MPGLHAVPHITVVRPPHDLNATVHSYTPYHQRKLPTACAVKYLFQITHRGITILLLSPDESTTDLHTTSPYTLAPKNNGRPLCADLEVRGKRGNGTE